VSVNVYRLQRGGKRRRGDADKQRHNASSTAATLNFSKGGKDLDDDHHVLVAPRAKENGKGERSKNASRCYFLGKGGSERLHLFLEEKKGGKNRNKPS